MSSPDPAYDEKYDHLKEIRQEVRSRDDAVLVYQDEVSFYHRPPTAPAYSPKGSEQPTYHYPPRTEDKYHRITGAMELQTGAVEFLDAPKLGRDKLLDLYEQLVDRWPDKQIYVVQDNCPVHFHKEVMQQLEPQEETRWVFPRPDNWPDPTEAIHADGPWAIQLVRLPTHAPWLNPIEKLWRWLKQEVIRMHPFGDDWEALKNAVTAFLSRFEDGSDALLEYTGLSLG